ncbi:MAG: glycine cleavage T C-terminal barrel domain-containing protein [Pseudomonadota bacterium]
MDRLLPQDFIRAMPDTDRGSATPAPQGRPPSLSPFLDGYTPAVRPSPLHYRTAELNETNDWQEVDGVTLPLSLNRPETEYAALRTTAVMTDVSMLRKYWIAGLESQAFLDRLLTRPATSLGVGQSGLSLVCNDQSLVLGIVRLHRLGEAEFLLSGEAPLLAWLMRSVHGFKVQIEDVTERLGAICVAGPQAFVVVNDALTALPAPPNALAYRCQVAGIEVLISSGMSGLGDALDVFMPADEAVTIWDRLHRAVTAQGGSPIGTQIAENRRIERGVPRWGAEYGRAPLTVLATELSLARAVAPGPAYFTGRRAYQRASEHGRAKVRVGVIFTSGDGDDRWIGAPGPVRGPGLRRLFRPEGTPVGVLTSLCQSPGLGQPVGLGYVSAAHAVPGQRVLIPTGSEHLAKPAQCVEGRVVFGAAVR